MSYLLCGVLLVTGLCGCQYTGQMEETGSGDSIVESSTVHNNPGENGREGSMENTENLVQNGTEQPNYEITIKDISSAELVSGMKIGWNLGNTLDATGGVGVDSERSWGNPKTTQEMIDAILDKGFNVIRIPVTWVSTMICMLYLICIMRNGILLQKRIRQQHLSR